MSRWFITFEAIDPNNIKGRWETGIPEKLYKKYQIQGHEKAIARIMLVREVLGVATRYLYRGWSRPDKDDSFVYVGTPSCDFKSLTIQTPPPRGMVFLVFVLPDGTIDEWTWRRATGDEHKPDGVTGELIWSANQS